jgi:hypothetical protein
VIVADNQRPAARALPSAAPALVADVADASFEADFDRGLMRLLRDAALRRQLAAASAEVCDGLGAGRTAEAFLQLIAARAA